MLSQEEARDVRLDALRSRVSVIRIIERLKEYGSGGGYTGVEREYLTETATRARRIFDETRPMIDFALLAERSAHSYRALTAGTGSQGGYTITTDVPRTIADILRPWSILARAGVTFMTDLRSNAALPKLTGAVTAYWLDGDQIAITDSGTETYSQVAVTPHTCGATLKLSRQLLIQAPGAESMVATDLLRTSATLVDNAVVAGTGTAGQPAGIAITSGVGTQSLASATWASCVAMKTTLGNANVIDDGTVTYIATPTVKGGLEARDRSGGTSSGRFIIEDDRLDALPAFASTVIPSGDMILARWSDVIVPTWGDGLELTATPYAASTDFQQGLLSVRVMLSLDIALRYPAAVVLGTAFS